MAQALACLFIGHDTWISIPRRCFARAHRPRFALREQPRPQVSEVDFSVLHATGALFLPLLIDRLKRASADNDEEIVVLMAMQAGAFPRLQTQVPDPYTFILKQQLGSDFR